MRNWDAGGTAEVIWSSECGIGARGMSVSGDCGSGGTVALGSRLAVRFWLALLSVHARRCDFAAALPSAHAQPSVSIYAFCHWHASRAYVSVGVFCTRLTPGFPFLSMRFALGARPGLTFLSRCFALGSHPAFRFCRSSVLGSSCLCDSAAAHCPRLTPSIAVLAQLFALGSRPAFRFYRCVLHSARVQGLRFCWGVLPRFTPAVCRMATNRTACDVLRFYFRRVEIAFVRSRGVVRLSAFVGSLRV